MAFECEIVMVSVWGRACVLCVRVCFGVVVLWCAVAELCFCGAGRADGAACGVVLWCVCAVFGFCSCSV